MKYKTEYTVQDSQLLHKGVLVNEYKSKDEALAVLSILETAYNEGITDAYASFYGTNKTANVNRPNLRFVLHIILALALLSLIFTATVLPFGWFFIYVAGVVVAGGAIYGLGRIQRVIV